MIEVNLQRLRKEKLWEFINDNEIYPITYNGIVKHPKFPKLNLEPYEVTFALRGFGADGMIEVRNPEVSIGNQATERSYHITYSNLLPWLQARGAKGLKYSEALKKLLSATHKK